MWQTSSSVRPFWWTWWAGAAIETVLRTLIRNYDDNHDDDNHYDDNHDDDNNDNADYHDDSKNDDDNDVTDFHLAGAVPWIVCKLET